LRISDRDKGFPCSVPGFSTARRRDLLAGEKSAIPILRHFSFMSAGIKTYLLRVRKTLSGAAG
jgi:hypothetical protein